MQKFQAITLCLGFLLICPNSFAANGDQLIQLDNDRNNLLKQITNELSYGHLKLADAERLKGELDRVVSLETKYKEGHQVSLLRISNTIKKIRSDVNGAISPTKVWMGIDPQNKALKEKINAAFAAGKITKDEAQNLEQEEQTLRDREIVNDTTNGLEFDDAMSIAKEVNQLDQKIGELSSR